MTDDGSKVMNEISVNEREREREMKWKSPLKY